jgi:hypothetical protein
MVNRVLNGDPRFRYILLTLSSSMKMVLPTPKSEKYYLLPNEDDPYGTAKNKN